MQKINHLFGKRGIGIGLVVALLLGVSAMQAHANNIGDLVWCDLNANGIQDPSEPGINGVKVELYSCDGKLITFTNTAPNPVTGQAGWYQIHIENNWDAYKVKFIAPDGIGFTVQSQPGFEGVDSNPDSTGFTVCFQPVNNPDHADLTQDAGLLCEPTNPGTGTPGYWMNHPDAWPVDSIVIGGTTYTKNEAIVLMKLPVAGNKVLSMFPALVSAKLNVLIGNDSSCIADEIAAADEWMNGMDLLSVPMPKVLASKHLWKDIQDVYSQLDYYNNGLLCAPHRD